MRLKSYFADSVSEAMDQAARELGPEAMLVYSRETPAEVRRLGLYEVVFAQEARRDASEGEAVHESSSPPRDANGPGGGDGSGYQALRRELAELRRQIGRISEAFARTGCLLPPSGSRAERLQAIAGALLEAGLSGDLVHGILAGLQPVVEDPSAATNGLSGDAFRLLVRKELSARFSVDSRVGTSRSGAGVIAFVGPPGAGKTSALVKIAARFGLAAKKPVQILSMDMYRVGAAEQLRSYASILGAGFQPVETTAGLVHALEDHRRKDLVLIDTPGHAPGDLDAAGELADFLAGHAGIDVHLTLAASMNSADLSRCISRFAPFCPRKLLFTRLDETESAGAILTAAIETNMPLSFFSDGQRIPEDLREASQEFILDRTLPLEPEAPFAEAASEPTRGLAVSSRAAAA